MTKDELIRQIEDVLCREESAIPLYSQYLDNSQFFSDFAEDQAFKLRQVLMTLKNESYRHREIFKSLLEKIKGSPNDVF